MGYFPGFDVHRKYTQASVLDDTGKELCQCRLFHEDAQQMVDFLSEFPSDTPAALEAGAGWMWISDLLEGMGFDVHLAHPAAVKLIAHSRLKTDKVDARTLAQLLRSGFLPEAYRAPGELREKRMVLRHRESLVRWRTMAKNRAHAILRRYNVHLGVSDIFGRAGTEMLRGMLEPDERVDWLTSMPGVGKLTAYYLVAEIGDIGRFPSPEKLVSYAGLCPATHRSGGKLRHGQTGPAGRRLIKWVLVEAAHTAARGDSYFASVFHRLSRRKCKQKAYVAVARKMIRIVWQMLTEGRPYETRRNKTRVGSAGALAVR